MKIVHDEETGGPVWEDEASEKVITWTITIMIVAIITAALCGLVWASIPMIKAIWNQVKP